MRPSHASLAILLSLATAAAAEQPAAPARFTATTEVVASRGASTAEDTGRRVVVLERDEIRRLPVHDLQGLLAVLPGLGVVRRGARGVQADLGVRGATFEQVAVLVNDELDSSSLGRHHRVRSALFAEAGRRGSGWSGGVQGRVDHQEPWGTVTTLAAGGSVLLRRWTARFRDPSDADSWATLDLACERRIVDGVTLTLEASNLLDRSVEELDGVPLPGRWVTVSVAWQGAAR